MNLAVNESHSEPNYLLFRVKFSLLLLFQVPACVLSIFVFIYSISHRRLLQALQNQALLILLIVNFIQLTVTLPLSLKFFATGFVSPANPTFCSWWIYLEFVLYTASPYLMATISVQRHVLVFHPQLLTSRWIRRLLHHLPLAGCILYPIVLYLALVILYPCDGTQYDYSKNICGFAPCYLVFSKVMATTDWIINSLFPMFVNVLANVLLIIRVIRQKRRVNQGITWKQQRKLAIQLFCVSAIYLIGWFPSIIVGLVQVLGDPKFLIQVQEDYLVILNSLVCLFLPWICLGLLPEMLAWLKDAICCRGTRNSIFSSTFGSLAKRNRINPTRG